MSEAQVVSYKRLTALLAIKRTSEFTTSDEFATAGYRTVQLRLKMLEDQWKDFKEAQSEIMGLTTESETIDKYFEDMTTAEQQYIESSVALKDKMDLLRPANEPDQGAAVAAAPVTVNVEMPIQQGEIKNTWGEFDGTLTKWQGWHDCYIAAVHNNDKVTPAFKFAYLKKSLVGKAAKTLGEYQLTEGSYDEAWERIVSIFGKKYPICREYIRQFLRLPSLQSTPTENELRRMSNTTHETIRQLRALGLPVEHWNFMFVHLLHEKLDPETSRQWELSRQSEQPEISDMLSFIDKQASAMPSSWSNERSRNISVTVHNDRGQRDIRARDISADSVRATGKSTGANNKKIICEACDAEHHIFDCKDVFLKLSLGQKIEFLNRRRLCLNCTKRGHKAENCFSVRCGRCNGAPHNSIICPKKELEKQQALLAHQPNWNEECDPAQGKQKRQ